MLERPKIGGEDIKDYVKKAIRNHLHKNMNVRSRSLIAEFPDDVVKCIAKIQSYWANMTVAIKNICDIYFPASYTERRGFSNELYKNIPKLTGFVSFSGK